MADPPSYMCEVYFSFHITSLTSRNTGPPKRCGNFGVLLSCGPSPSPSTPGIVPPPMLYSPGTHLRWTFFVSCLIQIPAVLPTYCHLNLSPSWILFINRIAVFSLKLSFLSLYLWLDGL